MATAAAANKGGADNDETVVLVDEAVLVKTGPGVNIVLEGFKVVKRWTT